MMQPNPIQRFLGLARGVDSPFDLLGLTPEQCDGANVRAALRRRLERLRRHPESLSHEADEVRLALHAAAAQLLDPAVRDQLAALARSSSDVRPAAMSSRAAFRELATHVIARAGGWNRESRQWLGLLAHAHGVNDRELQEELRAIVTGVRRTEGSSPSPRRTSENAQAPQPTLYESIHAPRRRRRGLSIGTPFWVILSTATVAAVLGAILLREAAPRRTTPPAAADRAPQTPATAPAPAREDSPTPSAPSSSTDLVLQQLSSPEVILRWLDLAHDELRVDPGQAAWRFERAVEALSIRWPEFSPGALTEAQHRTISFIHRIEASSLSGDRALAAIGAGADAMQPSRDRVTAEEMHAATWSGAALALVASDREIQSAVRRRAADALRAFGVESSPTGESFADAAEAALPALARRLVAWQERHPTADAKAPWSAWIDAVESVADVTTIEGRHRADRVILQAAEALLTSEAHVATRAGARDALASLLSAVRWTASSPDAPPPSWGVVLTWFDEPAIDVPDLAVVTEWIVSRSGAPAVTPEMTLSRGSIVESRAALRDRYARAWDADVAADSRGFAAVWARTIRETLPSISTDTVSEKLAQTALLSRFNAAAALRWRGDVNGAGAIVVDPMSPVHAAQRAGTRPMGDVRTASADRDGVWALRYLGSRRRDIETKTNLLAELGRAPWPLGPIDADVLVGVALQSPANELRTRAQEVVRRRAAEPGVVSAMLDTITKAPRNASTTALVADITGRRAPSPADSSWERVVRLALVDRLLEMLAPMDDWTIVDQLSAVVADAYARRADLPRQARDAGFGAESAAAPARESEIAPHQASETLYHTWRDRAAALSPNSRAPIPLEEIERRRAARARLAIGPLQRFVADQISVAEAMAFVISAERPSRAPTVADVMERFSAARAAPGDVADQSLAAERAMLSLWAIRFGLSVDDVLTDLGAAPPSAPARPIDAPPTPIDVNEFGQRWLNDAPVPDLRRRLEALTPDDPVAAFNLAEELAYESRTPTGRDLARRLFALAHEWDQAHDTPRGLGASVHLALAELSTRRDERRWLLAVALSLEPSLARVITIPKRERAPEEARLALAQALELYRLGEYGESQRRLETPRARELLDHYDAILTGGARRIEAELTTESICRECHNDRVVPDPRNPGSERLCPTCDGDPGPDLTDEMLIQHLRLERAILEDEPTSWSAALMATRGEGMREVGVGP